GFFDRLSAATTSLSEGIAGTGRAAGVAFSAQSIGGMFGIYFAERPPQSHAEVLACDRDAFNRFFHAMLDSGIYLAPSAFEAGFVSAAHTARDIQQTLDCAQHAFHLTRALA